MSMCGYWWVYLKHENIVFTLQEGSSLLFVIFRKCKIGKNGLVCVAQYILSWFQPWIHCCGMPWYAHMVEGWQKNLQQQWLYFLEVQFMWAGCQPCSFVAFSCVLLCLDLWGRRQTLKKACFVPHHYGYSWHRIVIVCKHVRCIVIGV